MSMLSRFIAFFTQGEYRADQKAAAQLMTNIGTDVSQEERKDANANAGNLPTPLGESIGDDASI